MLDRDDRKESEGSACSNTGQASPSATSWLRRRRLLSLLLALFLVASLFLGGSWLVHGQMGKTTVPQSANTIAKDTSLTRQQVVAQDRPAVVLIDTYCQGRSSARGSGVIIDPQGYIVTNYHVVGGSDKLDVILFDTRRVESAKLIGVDPSDDLAVLKIEPPKRLHLHAMSIGDSSQLHVGDNVLAIGYPLSYDMGFLSQTVTGGLISALGRTQGESEGPTNKLIDTIQDDASTNPGNSGGALVNMQAQLVGINTAGRPTKKVDGVIPVFGFGFAIPSNRVNFIVKQFIQYGRIIHSGHSTIGVTTVTVHSELAAQDELSVDHGAFIVDVPENSPAAHVGLKFGDVVVRVNNTPVNNATGLTDALMPEDPGSTVTLGIMRDGQPMQVKVELQELPIKVTLSEPCPNQQPVPGKG